jgi:tetratricopeptide (TPR) repeat protein
LCIIAFCLLNFLVFRPYHAELLYFQGLRHTVDQEYDLALMKFDQAYRFNPYDGKNLHALGGTYLNLKNYEKVEALLVKAKHYLTDINTFYNLGLVYSQIGLYKKAEEEFKQAIYLNPKFTKGYHYLGLLYFQQNDYNKAIEQWSRLLEIEPNFTNKYIVLNNLGIVYQKKEMPDKALEYFVQTLQLVPEDDPIEKEIEEEINKIYKSNLKN